MKNILIAKFLINMKNFNDVFASEIIPCKTCDGAKGKYIECQSCEGDGFYFEWHDDYDDEYDEGWEEDVTCPDCHRKGEIFENCVDCNGYGFQIKYHQK